MELFKNVNIKWMANWWKFLIASALFFVIGWFSVIQRGGFLFNIDFTGGTLIKLKLSEKPDLDRLRPILEQKLNAADVSRYDEESKNQIQIRLKRVKSEEASEFQHLGNNVYNTMKGILDQDKATGLDLNRVGSDQLAAELRKTRVLENMGRIKADSTIEEADKQYAALAASVIDFRTSNGGLITSHDQLSKVDGLPKPAVDALRQAFHLGSFTVLSIDSVGPKIGKELQDKASKAVLFSLLGMLVYIAIRFKFAYGVGAVLALFHDVLITLGLLSLFNKEISLTVIAALLTLIGFSINDTIVVFDRIRENLRIVRNETLDKIIDKSINQTLSRTIITSGLTFISVFCLWLLGGEVLDAFSFVLVVGIIIGTYSSIAVASPIMYLWFKYLGTAKEKKVLKFA